MYLPIPNLLKFQASDHTLSVWVHFFKSTEPLNRNSSGFGKHHPTVDGRNPRCTKPRK